MTARAALAALALTGCASAAAGDAAAAARISAGMQKLGATSQRGDCFGARIAGALDAAAGEEAAAVVEGARTKDEMRDGVLAASREVRRAYMGASFGCGR